MNNNDRETKEAERLLPILSSRLFLWSQACNPFAYVRVMCYGNMGVCSRERIETWMGGWGGRDKKNRIMMIVVRDQVR